MDDIASISRRIARLKKLVRAYFILPVGAIIERHTELLRVFDIRGSVHSKKHPHHMLRVYISRRFLKHFVESRKAELERNHTKEEALALICDE
ncbi:MAG: hypothetical protein NTV02_01455 [Candidatus Zambryskibacteria bacterium]|nr:hypothetical protein [Candidatus Zambryskibacteria bacterium]